MTTQRKDSMGEAATNSHLKMEKEPCSILQASGWTNNAIRIGGAIVHGLAASGPLIFSCVCLFLAYKNREKRSKFLPRSLSLAALHSGKVTLNNILASAEVRHDSSAVNLAFEEFKMLLNSDQIHFTKLQKEATKLEMTGQEDKAVHLLTEAHKKAKSERKSHEAYELEMLLVEMLIYNDALEKRCLNEKEISDVRRPLYKAIIHILLKNIEQAEEDHNEFLRMQSDFCWIYNITEESPEHDIGHNFAEFKMVVSNMKKDIEHAQKINRH
ncbi:TPR-like protein [Dioscorea alata]|uniref:TPR-like protein n=1 Tax=Dioscorea alata TaxID=55571 RepID=A0ACB7UCX8_DIOAL|nr:TPR-like protein [Dioscorea alata]